MKFAKVFALALVILICASGAQAAFIELNSGSFAGTTNISLAGEGSGRGSSFLANSTFSISSVGIYGELLNFESFDVVIYDSTDGHQANSVLHTASALLGGTGVGWNDIALNFTFTAGNHYVVNWRPTDGGFNDWGNIDLYYDSALPVNIGPLTLIDGFEGFNANSPSNFLHPNLRFDVAAVPEPSTLLLLGSGLVGLGFARRRFKA